MAALDRHEFFLTDRAHAAGHLNGHTRAQELVDPHVFPLDWYATLEHTPLTQHLVADLLLEGSLFVIYGESNSGKTFWLLDVCVSIAAGLPWRDKPTTRGLVLYVAGEGAASVKLRIAAVRHARQDIPAGIAFAVISQAVNLLSPESVDTLIRTLETAQTQSGERCALVVLDTFARAIPGGNENDAQDVGRAVAAADRIRAQVGCAVGFIHHSGKDPTKGARGSSALRAAADTEILIETQSGRRNAAVTKQRDLQPGTPMPFELFPVHVVTEGGAIDSCLVKQCDSGEPAAPLVRGKAQRQFLAALSARAETDASKVWTLVDLRAIGREIGLSKSTARSVVDALTASPYLKLNGSGCWKVEMPLRAS